MGAVGRRRIGRRGEGRGGERSGGDLMHVFQDVLQEAGRVGEREDWSTTDESSGGAGCRRRVIFPPASCAKATHDLLAGRA